MSAPKRAKGRKQEPARDDAGLPATELRAALTELDVTQVAFGAYFGCAGQTVRRWLAPGNHAPVWVRRFVELLRLRPELRQLIPFEARKSRGRPPRGER